MFRLRTLGGAALLRDGSPLDSVAAQRKTIALLAILAVARDRGISRDRIGLHLWPESDMERARGALKQALHVLRRQLGAADAVLGTAELRLNPQYIETDVDDFLAALEAGDLERAIDLYGGPFLDGFHVAGAVDFEQWADAQRESLARRQAEALEQLARRAEERRAFADPVALWAAAAVAGSLQRTRRHRSRRRARRDRRARCGAARDTGIRGPHP